MNEPAAIKILHHLILAQATRKSQAASHNPRIIACNHSNKMSGMIDPQIFEHLKTKIDEDTKARDDLNQITQKLERDVSYTQGLLSRVHSTPRSHYANLLEQVEKALKTEVEDVASLSKIASKYPYYKCVIQPPFVCMESMPFHHDAYLPPLSARPC